MSLVRTASPLRALIVTALLCVLAMRVAIPGGYMLDPGTSGWPRLIACPADSPVPVALAGAVSMAAAMSGTPAMPGHSHKHKHDGGAADHPCAFAAASAAVDLAALPAPLLLPADRIAPAALLHLFARPGLGLAAPPPPKTGPPTLA